MSMFKIAWRSIQHRGLGSLLTIISMALGVMMVVTVLAVHGLVSKAFNDNSSFGYNVLVGARGGEVQLAFSSIYYLTAPVENIPYEYYLGFCDQEQRQQELKSSIAYAVYQSEAAALAIANGAGAVGVDGSAGEVADAMVNYAFARQQESRFGIHDGGIYDNWTHTAVPIALGDFWIDQRNGAAYRCVGTKPEFFTEMVLSIDPERRFEFAQGRCFDDFNDQHGYYEAVIGDVLARKSGLKIGDTIQPTHGDPNDDGSHLHETDFHIVGILKNTGTANDRVLFLNMEGFFLMEGHAKTLVDDSVTGKARRAREKREREAFEKEAGSGGEVGEGDAGSDQRTVDGQLADKGVGQAADDSSQLPRDGDGRWLSPLQIEKREVTSILVRTVISDDGDDTLGFFLPGQINEGHLETTLDWSPFRPEKSQKAAQAINPVVTVTGLFSQFVDPIRWVLLALTTMICVVSAIGILVGIYNSMAQRRHEIAVMRALGASRWNVTGVMFCEAVLMALLAGMIGWAAGHGLTALLSPLIEEKTGVQVGFFDFAPKIPIASFWGAEFLPTWVVELTVSPEFLVVPAMVLLAVLIGVYPAISAYKTDVSKSLGK